MPNGAYSPELGPVARPGDVVRLDENAGEQGRHYEVKQLIPQPHTVTETITVPAGDISRDNRLESLETWTGWLAQYRPLRLPTELPTGVTLKFDQGGKQAPVWATRNDHTSVDEDTGKVESTAGVEEQLTHLYELFIHEDEVPYLTVENQSGSSVDVELTYSGFAYNLEPFRGQPDRQPVVVTTQAIRGDT